jgi:vacuolar-type H+-ATPase catalytic subunit A/Vma1
MMESCSDWQKLKCYMETEKILLNTYSERNKILRELVRTMDWTALDIQLRELEDLSCQIDEIDKRREKSFERIKKSIPHSKSMTFFDLSSKLNPELRTQIRNLHNHLKIITNRVKIESKVTSAYVEARNRSLHEMLGEILPGTKNLYSPAGLPVKGSSATSSLLIDRHF